MQEALLALTAKLNPRTRCTGRARHIRSTRHPAPTANCKWQQHPSGFSAPPQPPALDLVVPADAQPAPSSAGLAVLDAEGGRASVNSAAGDVAPASEGCEDRMRVLQAPPAKARKVVASVNCTSADVGDDAQRPSSIVAEDKWAWGSGDACGSYTNGFHALWPLGCSDEAGSTQAVPPLGSVGATTSGGGGGICGGGKGGGGGSKGGVHCGFVDGDFGGSDSIGGGQSNSSGAAAWHSVNGGGLGNRPPPLWLPPPSITSTSFTQAGSVPPGFGPDVTAAGDGVSRVHSFHRKSRGGSPLAMPTQDYGRRRGSALAAAAAAEAAASAWQSSPRVASSAPPAQAGWRMQI